MAIYDELGIVDFTAGGHASVTYRDNIITLYGPGDVVYNVHKAKLGVIEKIVVKYPKIVKNAKTYGKVVVLYKDTFNALWNESDLIVKAEAVALATAYYEDLLVELDEINV